jgi:hypothetical protein
MNIISFDIDTRNFAFSIITSDNQLIFKLIDLDSRIKRKEKNPLGRCRVLHEILLEATSLLEPNAPLRIIIEKQVQSNVVAMGLVYPLLSIALNFTEDVILFDPKQKFILWEQEYSTINKAHKSLSIKLSRDIISKQYPGKLIEFNNQTKKDDIADSFLMAYLSRN